MTYGIERAKAYRNIRDAVLQRRKIFTKKMTDEYESLVKRNTLFAYFRCELISERPTFYSPLLKKLREMLATGQAKLNQFTNRKNNTSHHTALEITEKDNRLKFIHK